MIKAKGIIAVGIILLFIGTTFSPVLAQPTVAAQSDYSVVGDITSVQLSDKDLTILERFLPTIFEKMQTAKSYSDITHTLQSMVQDYGRYPVLVFLLTLAIKSINFNFKFGQFRPIRKNAFIMSWGFTNKFVSLGKNKISIIRPITAWYYSGKSNLLLNSRTIIFDPYPFSIRTLTGRQIGLMANFIGFYIHRSGNIADKAITFIFGFADTIRGIDLSPRS